MSKLTELVHAGMEDRAQLPPVEVLLRDGDWTIEKMRNSTSFAPSRSRFVSLVKHVCYPAIREKPENTAWQVVVYPDDSTHCWCCTALIPEGMIAVWKFQNWEELAYGG